MAITLEQAKVGMANKVSQGVIEAFQQNSTLLNILEFDDAVSPSGGSTLVYGYMQEKMPSTAAFRKLNSEYVPSEAVREEKTASLAILGGSFSIDRVIAQSSSRALSEVEYQINQKVKASCAAFSNAVINGDKLVGDSFDGIKKLLTGTDTDFTTAIDLSTSDAVAKEANAFIDELDALISEVPGANIILCNAKMKTKLNSIARRTGYYSRSEDAFGRGVDYFNGIPVLDVGKCIVGGKEVSIIPTYGTGTTDLYVAKLGMDGLHGITVDSQLPLVNVCLPDFNEAKAIHTGDVEMLCGVVLKSTKSAAILRGVKIAPEA